MAAPVTGVDRFVRMVVMTIVGAALLLGWFAVSHRPSRPPHTPRPPAGPTNVRPATHAPHR